MSTRCQIEFVGKEGNAVDERILVYRHSDGYPEGVVPDLKEFLKWNGGRISDIEYTSANFIYWSKRRFEELYYGDYFEEEKNKKWSEPQSYNSNLLLGFGICEKDVFHGDIDYFYQVIVDIKWDNSMSSEVKSVKIKCYEVPYVDGKLKRSDFKLIDTIKIK